MRGGMVLDNTACGTATPCPVSLLTTGTGINDFTLNVGGDGGLMITYGAVIMNKVL